MAGCKDISDEAKKTAEVAQKKEQQLAMVSFILNGSEITTWIEHNFITKSAKSKATFSRQQHLF